MATARQWVAGARPRTLSAAVVPVAVGTGVAASYGQLVWWRAALALFVALALQVGVNYANDYSDGIRGTDTARVGPLRLVGSGVAAPRAVFWAALGCLAAAGVAGLVLTAVTSWWLLVFGAVAIASAWFYTGGPRPYGYHAMGEVSVFVFFGLFAVTGTAYVQMERFSLLAVAASVPVGLLATALLIANNLRDIATDASAGKRTLAVVLGDRRTRLLYAACLVLPFFAALALLPARPWAAMSLLAAPLSIGPLRSVLGGTRGPTLVPVLAGTSRLQLGYGLLLAPGLAIT